MYSAIERCGSRFTPRSHRRGRAIAMIAPLVASALVITGLASSSGASTSRESARHAKSVTITLGYVVVPMLTPTTRTSSLRRKSNSPE